MLKWCWVTSVMMLFVACSKQKPIGKRVSLSEARISLILPDSSLKAAKPFLWGPDCSSCDYSTTYYFHNADSTSTTGITVKVYPDTLGIRWPWKWLFNEQRTKDDFTAMNRGYATIEKLTADSISKTVTIDARFTRQGHHAFMKEITIRRRQHQIQFHFFVPDNAQMRTAVANSEASIFIDPRYMDSPAESYQDFRSSL